MDGQTDRGAYMTKLTAAFRNFANAPENVISLGLTNTYAKMYIISMFIIRTCIYIYICHSVCESNIKFQNVVYFNT